MHCFQALKNLKLNCISVTAGAISWVERTRYVQGASHLMVIQIDAAISPGSNGDGLAWMEENFVIVAIQNFANAGNIGYVETVNHTETCLYLKK
jgi:S1-C subfamily serine protease